MMSGNQVWVGSFGKLKKTVAKNLTKNPLL